MNYGSSDRVSESRFILLTSVLFTLAAYFIFDYVWGINIPLRYLLAVIALQLVSLLLGSIKLLTRLSAAFLSALIAVAAGIAAVVLLFPPDRKLLVAVSIGCGGVLLFIILPFIAASRSDPIPDNDTVPLFIDDVEDIQDGELIKYGEIEDSGEGRLNGGFALEDEMELMGGGSRFATDGEDEPFDLKERVYEFDELSEERLDLALGGGDGKTSAYSPGIEGPDPGPLPESPALTSDMDFLTEPGMEEGIGDAPAASGNVMEGGAEPASGEEAGYGEGLPAEAREGGQFDSEDEDQLPTAWVPGGDTEDGSMAVQDSPGPRYVLYDRKTMQAMKEYLPEGEKPRIDRLTLYRMFPDYNFKSFEIDSIRWEEDEVRIFIRGEKKN